MKYYVNQYVVILRVVVNTLGRNRSTMRLVVLFLFLIVVVDRIIACNKIAVTNRNKEIGRRQLILVSSS